MSKEAFDVFQHGVLQLREDHFTDALGCFDQALALVPNFSQALCNRGLAQQMLGEFDASITSFEESLELAPTGANTHMNLSMSSFLQQDLARGWEEYRWRWKSQGFEAYPQNIQRLAPEWCGTSLEGKRILVFGEQGIGDEIMFASCLPDVINAAASCVIACTPRLIPLFRRSFPSAQVVSRDHLPAVEGVDWQAAAGTVASYLR